MRFSLRKLCIAFLMITCCHLGFSQSDDTKKDNLIKVLVIPPYDVMANAGKSPQVATWIKEALKGHKNIELVPFDKNYYQVTWQMVFDKKYLGPILSVGQSDLIIMSKLDLVKVAKNFDDSTWNLAIRFYHVKNETQDDPPLFYKKLDPIKIKKELMGDSDQLASIIKIYFQSGAME